MIAKAKWLWEESADLDLLDLERANLGLGLFEERMLPEIFQVGILDQRLKIPIAVVDGLAQRGHGLLDFLRPRITAGQIVKRHRVLRPQRDEAAVHAEAFLEFAAARIVVAQHLKGFNVLRVATHHAFEEGNLNVQIPQLTTIELTLRLGLFLHTTSLTTPKMFRRPMGRSSLRLPAVAAF